MVEFHIDKLKVSKNADATVRASWTALLKHVRRNPHYATDGAALKRYLDEKKQETLDKCQAKNSVEYIFYCSVREDDARLQFLMDAARVPSPPVGNVPKMKGATFR
ncbi:hypothetical protein [Cupriavidus necator]